MKESCDKLGVYFTLARSEPRIVGSNPNPWHYNYRSMLQTAPKTDQMPQNAPTIDQSIGADEMPTVVDKLREIGTFITKQRVPPHRSLWV